MNGRTVALAGIALAAVVAVSVLGTVRWARGGGLLGDANCDGAVNGLDGALVLQYDAGLIGSLACEDTADVNGNGAINPIDAALILQYDAGLIDALGPTVPPTATPLPGADGQLAELVGGNSAFAFELYRALRGEEGNLFFSPHSISAALAMTYAGARGETEQEMAETLNYTLPQEQLHPAFNALDLELAQRSEVEPIEGGDPFRLNIANAVWGEREYEFLAEFLDTLAQHYGAGLRLVDFINDPEGAREAINTWVSDQTEGRIPELIPQGAIDAFTRLVLTNAIYFNASWAFPFDKEATQEGTFHLLDGAEVQAPMMSLDEGIRYAEVDGVQAVELPYVGRQLSMVVLLPREGQFETSEAALDAAWLDSMLDDLGDMQVLLTMPKFEFESSFTLNDALVAMGMPSAFALGAADFSGMDGTRGLSITAVLHKAFVSVDEQGTEAAAATAVIVGLTSVPPGPVELVIDRPFIFLIRDIPTGAILFVGRVLDPTLP